MLRNAKRGLISAFACAMTFGGLLAHAQTRDTFHPDRMDTVLYGVAYYPEYMPYERLDQDVQLMQKAGITVVRIGEFSWGLWEPEAGKFEFAWMDRGGDKLRAAGIRIIIGTPTASIPAWLYKEHPEIVVTRLGGQYLYYGYRQNTDLSNPTYRFYCERSVRSEEHTSELQSRLHLVCRPLLE